MGGFLGSRAYGHWSGYQIRNLFPWKVKKPVGSNLFSLKTSTRGNFLDSLSQS
jgi:hypothetical protein